MHQSIKIKLLVIVFAVTFFSCENKKSEIINYINNNDYSCVRGGTELNNINFAVFGKEKHLGDSIIIFYDKNYKIKNFLRFNCPSSYQPVFISNKYITYGFMRNEETGLKNIVVYNINKNQIQFVEVDYHFIWNLFICGDELFYSSEMANPHLNAVNLKTGKQVHCNEYYCPEAKFDIIDGNVIAKSYIDDSIYIWQNDTFKKSDMKILDFVPNVFEINDYFLGIDIFSKLKLHN